MPIVVGVLALTVVLGVLWDAFDTVVLPRRVSRRLRFTELFYRTTWRLWRGLARTVRRGKRKEKILGYYGPLSLLLLLTIWAGGMIVAFGALQWSVGSRVSDPAGLATFWTDLYFSGTTFFTLGLGDATPQAPAARALAVIEAGLGFGFLALVISYLPVVHQAFSRREASITLLDARAGSPPAAAALLARYADPGGARRLEEYLGLWERWTSELLESHISYPVLSFFRSQHDRQSWVAALTTILDACSLIIAVVRDGPLWQAQLTFAMARHAVVDIAQVMHTPPIVPEPERLPPAEVALLRETLAAAGVALAEAESADKALSGLRAMYEPYVAALGRHLEMPLPPWVRHRESARNWQTTAWGTPPTAPALRDEDHF